MYCAIVICGIFAYKNIRKERFPELTNEALLLTYKWEDNVALEVNKLRIERFINAVESYIVESSSILGEKQFIKENNKQVVTGGEVYLTIHSGQEIDKIQAYLGKSFLKLFPRANFNINDEKIKIKGITGNVNIKIWSYRIWVNIGFIKIIIWNRGFTIKRD